MKKVTCRPLSDQGLGLASWKTENTYLDLAFISKVLSRRLWTALNNQNGEYCNNDDRSCDGKLVNVLFGLCDLLFLSKSLFRCGNKLMEVPQPISILCTDTQGLYKEIFLPYHIAYTNMYNFLVDEMIFMQIAHSIASPSL